jgi:hypothetical protein
MLWRFAIFFDRTASSLQVPAELEAGRTMAGCREVLPRSGEPITSSNRKGPHSGKYKPRENSRDAPLEV